MPFGLFANPVGGNPPHPSVEPRVLSLIGRAIVKAWELIRTTPPAGFNLGSATEDQITTALHNTLVNRVLYPRLVRGFTRDLFRVAREPKVWAYDESSLDKMPDLFFYLISDREVAFPDQDGLFAECKPVDAAHAAGGHYCDKGLWRFVKGEYAWTMREGMMIGYAVTGYRLPDKLKAALAAGDRGTRMPVTSGPSAIPRTADSHYCQRPYASTHSRPFRYRNGDAAPPTVIRHMWLARD